MLNRAEIEKLIKDQDLVADYLNLDIQLTPNGFDLTVASIFEFDAAGALDFSNKERVIPEGKEIFPEKLTPQDKLGTSNALAADGERSRATGWWNLKKGAYKIKTNETVNLPKDLIGVAFSRTSLLRIGGSTQHGLWDAGFRGKSEFILTVDNPKGIRIKQNARIAQLTFHKIKEVDCGYQGIYQDKK
jgi:dUTP pyrophosphatase